MLLQQRCQNFVVDNSNGNKSSSITPALLTLCLTAAGSLIKETMSFFHWRLGYCSNTDNTVFWTQQAAVIVNKMHSHELNITTNLTRNLSIDWRHLPFLQMPSSWLSHGQARRINICSLIEPLVNNCLCLDALNTGAAFTQVIVVVE